MHLIGWRKMSSEEEIYEHPTCLPKKVCDCNEAENGSRTHHYKLGNKVSELCTRIGDLEFQIEFLMSLIPDKLLCEAKKRFFRMLNQKAKVLEETKKLKDFKSDLGLIGVYNTY